MDKNWKLQRYNRKDYSEVVDFPVEIVGRDGVVRRYTFEDSIRLYHRRITFAPIRYRDGDLVDAEVVHCRSRIDQLRRSYFHRFGWGTPNGEQDPADVFKDLAGEVAAFLCRVLRSEGRAAVRFQRVGAIEDDVSIWFVTPDGEQHGMLLYVHAFVGPQIDAVRERFFRFLRCLEMAAPVGGDAEKLLAFHHSVDCGFVLTGRALEFPSMLADGARPMVVPAIEPAATPWDEALEMIRRGRHDEALARCQTVVKEQPWHRRAYVAGSMIAMHLEQPVVAEEFALVGARYYPEDAILHYYAGIARLQDQRHDGEASIRRALDLAPAMTSARAALVVHLLEQRQRAEALLLLEHPAATDPSMVALRRLLGGRSSLLAMVGLLLVAMMVVTSLLSAWGLLLGAAAVMVYAAFVLAFRRQLTTLRAHQHADEIRRGLKHLIRESPPVAN